MVNAQGIGENALTALVLFAFGYIIYVKMSGGKFGFSFKKIFKGDDNK